MPASVADPVALVLRTALSGKKGPYSHETENAPELLEDRLAASAKRVLLSSIEYEPAPKQQILSLDTLKSKYTVLNSSLSAKITALNGSSLVSVQETLPAPKVTLFRSEDVKVGWKGSVPVGAGMINMGNTCYMNSTLQALFHIPSLSNWLSSVRQCKNCDPNGTQLCVVCIIAKTLQSTHEKSGSVVKPILVYNRLKLICKHLVHGRQEDAHEFMRYLIEAMEKAYLQSVCGTKLDSRSKETNPLGQIFGGYIRTEVTCLKCKHTSTTFQHFQDIPLDIQHASTLDDALGHYFRRERLEGDNAYKCEKCKSKVPATKKFSIERAPNVLCIQLKRFGLMGGKMSKHIQFSRNLNLNRFLFHQSPGGPCVTYKFVSLINHMGPSQHCGHYTAIAEASNGQLYLFDDCSVRLISLNVAMSTGAYVLIYEKVQSSPSTPNNGIVKMNSIQSNSSAPTPKLPIPRPAIISEPSRPKIHIELKKVDPVQQKPRLIIRNGTGSLFKSASAPAPTPTTPVVNGQAVKQEQRAIPPAIPKTSPLKNPTALVPYDGESSEEEQEKEIPTVNTTEINASAVLLKATETKWQVSPSPVPIEAPPAVCNGGATVAAKWQVSDSSQQDNSSSSTTSSGCASQKWIVRSLSDTESERANPSRHQQKVYYSDTEMDPPSNKATPPLKKLGNKIRLLSGKVFGPSTKQAEVTLTNEVCNLDDTATSSGRVQEAKNDHVKQDVPAAQTASKVPVESSVKCSNVKWDGSRNTDTVKELLRMSHSGFSDQVRTWDGGKSHLTKQVEDDKRLQRKRTADDLLDEELDKGKIKKIKSVKEENRESSPSRNGYNPFQVFQDSVHNNKDQKQHHQKPDHFKNNQSHNRYGYQGNRGKGFRSRGGSDHHRSKSQTWRRFR